MVARWRTHRVRLDTNGIQGRSRVHRRASALRRALRHAVRRDARRATHRQPVGRRHACLAAVTEAPVTSLTVPSDRMSAAGWRIVILASLGGTLEFYDFVIFGIFAKDIAD